MKICPVGAKLSHADGEIHDEAKSNFAIAANTTKNQSGVKLLLEIQVFRNTDSPAFSRSFIACSAAERGTMWRNMTQYQRHTVTERQLRHKNWTGTCTVHLVRIKLTLQYPGTSGFLLSTYQTLLRQTERRGRVVRTTTLYSGGTRVNSRPGDRIAIFRGY